MKHSHHQKRRSTNESGNVLIYILIAIALISALSYAVSSSNRGSLAGVDSERTRLQTSEILEYADIVSKAVTQLRLRGCDDTEFSFQNNITATDYTNTGDPTGDDTCHIFHVSGGGIQYRAPDTNWLDSANNAEDFYGELFFTGTSCVADVGPIFANCTTEAPASLELMMVIPFIKEDLCIALNETLGVGTAGAAPPQDSSNAWSASNPEFTGAYTDSISLLDVGTGDLRGKTSGCFEGANVPDGGYHFYKVLLAR